MREQPAALRSQAQSINVQLSELAFTHASTIIASIQRLKGLQKGLQGLAQIGATQSLVLSLEGFQKRMDSVVNDELLGRWYSQSSLWLGRLMSSRNLA